MEGQWRRLRQLQEEWWARINAAEGTLTDLRERRRALTLDVERIESRLGTLVQLNVANDCFYIWHSGPFATINGCRLGRLPSYVQVEWADINAGLGQVMLLLATVVERAGFRFRQYQLQPFGSSSRLLKLAASANTGGGGGGQLAASAPSPSSAGATRLNLYYDEANLAFFPRRNFNYALTAFLKCVHEFGAFVEQQDPTLRLPYRIEEGQVGGLPIALTQGQEETWTRAMKYLMTDLKWLLAWSSRRVSI